MSDTAFQIDERIRSHIPPLRPEEARQLEENIARNGCQSPLIVWDGLLLDGHNRFEICNRLGLPFNVEQIELPNFDAAIDWIEDNQLGRRNLTADQFSYFIGRKYERTKRREGRPEKLDQNDPVSTAEKVAEQHGISAPTVKRAADFARDVDEIAHKIGDGARTEILAGALNATRADVKEVAEAVAKPETGLKFETAKEAFDWVKQQRSEKAEVRARENAEVRAKEVIIPDGRYGVIVIDPPWPMQKIERDVAPNQVDFDYPTMSEAELYAFCNSVAVMAADDCHLFMWTTQKFLPLSLSLIETCGFRYVLAMVWHKNGGFQPFGLPQYNCEFVVYARKGSPHFIDTKAFFCCFNGERREHSRKPEEFYDVIRRVTSGSRIDVFSRETHDGFEAFGNEAGKFSGAA